MEKSLTTSQRLGSQIKEVARRATGDTTFVVAGEANQMTGRVTHTGERVKDAFTR